MLDRIHADGVVASDATRDEAAIKPLPNLT